MAEHNPVRLVAPGGFDKRLMLFVGVTESSVFQGQAGDGTCARGMELGRCRARPLQATMPAANGRIDVIQPQSGQGPCSPFLGPMRQQHPRSPAAPDSCGCCCCLQLWVFRPETRLPGFPMHHSTALPYVSVMRLACPATARSWCLGVGTPNILCSVPQDAEMPPRRRCGQPIGLCCLSPWHATGKLMRAAAAWALTVDLHRSQTQPTTITTNRRAQPRPIFCILCAHHSISQIQPARIPLGNSPRPLAPAAEPG